MPFNPLQYPLATMMPRMVSQLSSWVGHIPFAFTLVQMARPKTIVELGVLQGDSYLSFCQAVAALQLPTRCWGIDAWQYDPQSGINGDELLSFLKSVHDPELSRFSQLVRAPFNQAAAQFAPGSIDLLHLDGNPSYPSLRDDLQTWLPKMSAQGIILLHGIMLNVPDGGARRLWGELSQGRPNFTFENAGGLGVVVVGAAVARPVLEFIRDAATDPRTVRGYFTRLGESVEQQQQQKRLVQSLINTQVALNDWKKRAGLWVDPKGIDVQSAVGDSVRFATAVSDQVRVALNDDLQIREQLAAASSKPPVGLEGTEPGASQTAAAAETLRTFSVVICSIDNAKFTAIEQMYRRLLGDTAQIIRIPDARGMCEGYNRGIKQSTGDVLIFSHDDIEILNADFAQRLFRHLENYDMVGVAGTNRLVAGYWIAAGPPYIFGQVAHTTPQHDYSMNVFGGHGPVVGNIRVLDGLMFAVKRSVIEKIQFDESFDSFHLYDLDFCTSAYTAGFKLAVALDLFVIHDSIGKFDQRWQQYAKKFETKWAAQLQPHPNRAFHVEVLTLKTKDEVIEVSKLSAGLG